MKTGANIQRRVRKMNKEGGKDEVKSNIEPTSINTDCQVFLTIDRRGSKELPGQ